MTGPVDRAGRGAQQSMAVRAHATTTTYDAGHVELMTHPSTVTKFIERATRATTR